MTDEAIDWAGIGESISGLDDMVRHLREAWARQYLSDQQRLREVKFFLSKAEWELVRVSDVVL